MPFEPLSRAPVNHNHSGSDCQLRPHKPKNITDHYDPWVSLVAQPSLPDQAHGQEPLWSHSGHYKKLAREFLAKIDCSFIKWTYYDNPLEYEAEVDSSDYDKLASLARSQSTPNNRWAYKRTRRNGRDFHQHWHCYGESSGDSFRIMFTLKNARKSREREYCHYESLFREFWAAIKLRDFGVFCDTSNQQDRPNSYSIYPCQATYLLLSISFPPLHASEWNIRSVSHPVLKPGVTWTLSVLNESGSFFHQCWQVNEPMCSLRFVYVVCYPYKPERFLSLKSYLTDFFSASGNSGPGLQALQIMQDAEVHKYFKHFIDKACNDLHATGLTLTTFSYATREWQCGTVDSLLDNLDPDLGRLRTLNVHPLDIVQGFLRCFDIKLLGGKQQQLSIDFDVTVKQSDIILRECREASRSAFQAAVEKSCKLSPQHTLVSSDWGADYQMDVHRPKILSSIRTTSPTQPGTQRCRKRSLSPISSVKPRLETLGKARLFHYRHPGLSDSDSSHNCHTESCSDWNQGRDIE